MDEENLNKTMLDEDHFILFTVNWLESQIDEQLELFEDALAEDNEVEADLIEKKIHNLLEKLVKEEKEMDKFMNKFGKIIKDKKE